MKKIVMTAAVVACAAVVTAQTVTSANIVGYGKVQNAEGLQIVSMQFDNGQTNTLESLFGADYPLGTKVLTYEGGYKVSTYEITYPPPTYQPTPAWNGAVTSVYPGQGFWVQMAAGESTVESVLSGEVPMADSVTNSVVSGLNLFSYPYPVETEIQDLGFTPTLGDKIYLYVNGGGYISINYEITYPPPNYTPVEAWSNPTAKVGIGSGFWYQTSTPTTWIANRPFTP